jgi:hypothetical protein
LPKFQLFLKYLWGVLGKLNFFFFLGGLRGKANSFFLMVCSIMQSRSLNDFDFELGVFKGFTFCSLLQKNLL